MASEGRRRYERKRRKDARKYIPALKKGSPQKNPNVHHRAMSSIKAELGDPRPEGMTLSLINPVSKDCYWGRKLVGGAEKKCRLSTNPGDYIWEDLSSNVSRNLHQWLMMYEYEVIDINGQPIKPRVHEDQLTLF